jgi:hypothetical protein
MIIKPIPAFPEGGGELKRNVLTDLNNKESLNSL